jgi:phage/plasmid-associated DNA primase
MVASRGDYAIPANSHRIVDEWCGDANNVWVWAADRVDANGSALMSDLYKDYASWTKDNGYKAQAIKTFGASLRTYATRISTKLMVEHTMHGNKCDGLSLRASAMHSMI